MSARVISSPFVKYKFYLTAYLTKCDVTTYIVVINSHGIEQIISFFFALPLSFTTLLTHMMFLVFQPYFKLPINSHSFSSLPRDFCFFFNLPNPFSQCVGLRSQPLTNSYILILYTRSLNNRCFFNILFSSPLSNINLYSKAADHVDSILFSNLYRFNCTQL